MSSKITMLTAAESAEINARLMKVVDLDVARLERAWGKQGVTNAIIAIAAAGLDDRIIVDEFFAVLEGFNELQEIDRNGGLT